MRYFVGIRALALVVVGSGAAGDYSPAANDAIARPVVGGQAAPVLLTVPAAPMPVTAAGRVTLVYELYVANVGRSTLRIEGIEVHNADVAEIAPVATYRRSELERDVKMFAPRGAPPAKVLSPGVRAVVYFWLAFDSLPAVPKALAHRVVFADGSTVDGGRVLVRPPADLTLAPPVGVGDWWIGLGPSNTSEHRRSVLRVGDDTVPHSAQRFAIDWVKLDAHGEYARDHVGRQNADWYGYGEPVLAAAEARVAAIMDSIPDNVPGEDSRAVPIRVSTLLGNYVLLDLRAGPGDVHRYALYGHLRPGSLRVHVGDTVRRGQILGAIGNSGNSDGPHLHYQVTEAADPATAPLRGEGVPWMLDAFTVVSHDPERVQQKAVLTALGPQRAALPVEGDVVRLVATRP
jgi:murein DD-endopeptidase MepM/ murein hydrolase activator NlpD